MRRYIWWGTAAGFTACLVRPTLASITPDYGYADGCIDVVIQGHHLGTEGTAKIGNSEFLALAPAEADPKRGEHAQDVGFLYTGLVPPSPDGTAGWYDVVLTVDGEELTIEDGFYSRSCPGSFVVDVADVPAQGAAGDRLNFEGCQLDDEVTVQFLDGYGVVVQTAALVSDCSTARVHAVVPTLPPGVYAVQLVHEDGTVFAGDCFHDSGDTGLTCVPLFTEVTARRSAE